MGPPFVATTTLQLGFAPQQRALQRVQSAPLSSQMPKCPHPESETLLCCTMKRRVNTLSSQPFFCPRNPRNRELVDDELPSTDTVKRTRSFFESKCPIIDMRNTPQAPARLWPDSASVSSGVSSAGDFSSPICKTATESLIASCSEDDEWEDSSVEDMAEEAESPPHYVSPIVMDRIRARGYSVTYFGSEIIASSEKPMSPTRAILTEIHRSTEYQAWMNPASGQPKTDFSKVRSKKDEAAGKCRLIKCNSCDSRLEMIDMSSSDTEHSTDTANQQESVGMSADEGDDIKHDYENMEVVTRCSVMDSSPMQVEASRVTWHWPGKTSVVFDFCGTSLRPGKTTGAPLTGAVTSEHARSFASTTTL